MKVYQHLIKTKNERKAGYFVLVDPDKLPSEKIGSFMQAAHDAGIDGILVGGSLLLSVNFDQYVSNLKQNAKGIPLIVFPGSLQQVTSHADAILFLSIISGREAHYLIGSQVLVAPMIHRVGLEAISTAYMLIESGRPTSAHFMSGSPPLPRHKPEIAVAHALAAQYLGFKLIYLEAGSGADHPVPEQMIAAVSQSVDIPVIVGGGIRSPEEAAKKVAAGASFVVTGTIIEKSKDLNLLKEFARAVHQ